jgi:hypothetical protein
MEAMVNRSVSGQTSANLGAYRHGGPLTEANFGNASSGSSLRMRRFGGNRKYQNLKNPWVNP